MSSIKIVEQPGEFPYVVFGGGYQCMSLSVVEAVKATEIEVEGIAGVLPHVYCTRTYPQGRFCCGKCGEWKALDMFNNAWAIRSSYYDSALACDKLVCEDCADSDEFSEGCQFEVLAQEDFYWVMRIEAKDARAKSLVRKWQEYAKLRKERREFVLKSALVFKDVFENRPESWQQAWSAFMAHA
jgi:hypothetical protein